MLNQEEPLCAALRAKIQEQIERVEHLLGLIPEEGLAWSPGWAGAWPTNRLLGHVLECLAGFCAVLAAAEPERLAHFQELRTAKVNHACGCEEAGKRIREYQGRIEEGLALLRDSDLARKIPTLFVSKGESLLTLLLGNLEHLINHKHQLFVYLKAMGVAAGSGDLYQFRGSPSRLQDGRAGD